MPNVCPTLEHANQSRRRAWRELQRIRKLLARHVDDLPPPPKPPNFETEGAILAAALERALRGTRERLVALQKAEALKPYLSNTKQDGKYPLLVLELNRAMNPCCGKR